jgi:hypothetical protein
MTTLLTEKQEYQWQHYSMETRIPMATLLTETRIPMATLLTENKNTNGNSTHRKQEYQWLHYSPKTRIPMATLLIENKNTNGYSPIFTSSTRVITQSEKPLHKRREREPQFAETSGMREVECCATKCPF